MPTARSIPADSGRPRGFDRSDSLEDGRQPSLLQAVPVDDQPAGSHGLEGGQPPCSDCPRNVRTSSRNTAEHCALSPFFGLRQSAVVQQELPLAAARAR